MTAVPCWRTGDGAPRGEYLRGPSLPPRRRAAGYPVAQNATFSAETSYHVARIMREGETDMFSTGRYLDRIVERDGALLFAERLVVFDSRRIDTLLVFPI